MRLIDHLKQQSSSEPLLEPARIEYRLACSGELLKAQVITADWRKQDVTRILLVSPVQLSVVSRPFDDYPQELCLRLEVGVVKETDSSHHITFHPDEEIVGDLCSILTLVTRRLVVPVTQISTQYVGLYDGQEGVPSHFLNTPDPLIRRAEFPSWKRRGATVITGAEGQRVIDHSPPPVEVYDSNPKISAFVR